MAIEHDFFGALEIGPDGSIFWSETVEIGDQAVSIDLTAPDHADVSLAALDVAAAMVNGLEHIDIAAREGMVAQLSDRTSEVTEYVLQQQEVLGDELDELFHDVSGDTPIDIIKALQLMSATFLADEHGSDDPFLVLEYALDPDATEDVLLVNFASDARILSVTSAE